ncbi:MAG: DUF3499 domain-containing protein [Corynebacterium sp.]|nr:DUF3499 domain-containing protein [Corynebacterium sp.]
MNQFRRCSRPGCGHPAVATLTYAYAQSTAYIGPLKNNDDPHSWDLCSTHAAKITAPLGWELIRVPTIEDDEDLTALVDAVAEAGLIDTHFTDMRTDAKAEIPPPDFGSPAPNAPFGHKPEEYVPNHPAHQGGKKLTQRAHLTIVPDSEEPDDDADDGTDSDANTTSK